MPKVSPLQNDFNGGEFSAKVWARVDAERYRNGLKKCLNYVQVLQGPLLRRPGSLFVAEVKDSSKKTFILPFKFSIFQAYIIEVGDKYMRFYMNHGEILNDADAIYEIETPYAEDDLEDIRIVQSADTLYIFHPSYQPRKLIRRDHDDWELTAITFLDGPYQPTNTTAVSLAPSATSGSVTITATPNQKAVTGAVAGTDGRVRLTVTGHGFDENSLVNVTGVTGTTEANGHWKAIFVDANTIELAGSVFANAYVSGGKVDADVFASGDVGRLVRIQHSSTWGWARITAVTNSYTATATSESNFGATTASKNWRLGLWSDTTGWPSCGTFHENRLTLGGPTDFPQRFDASVTGDYENFSPSKPDGTTSNDKSYGFALNSDDVQAIRWLSSDEKGLQVGTASAEWLVRPNSTTDALSSTNVNAKPSTYYGSYNTAPVRAGKSTLFVHRAQRKMRELNYVYTSDGFIAPDLTELAEHMTIGGIKQIAYQQEPFSIIWCRRQDGLLLGMTYDRSLESLRVGWHRHQLGGDGIVESIAVIPAPDGLRDELWMVVRRTINGVTKRYVEYLNKFFDDEDEQADAHFVDCGFVYDGSAATTISGLNALEGAEVAVLADGAVQTNKTVSAGEITLDKAASKVHVGFAYTSDVQMLRIEAGAADGTALGKTRRIHRVGFMFYRSLGLKMGRNFDEMDDIDFRTTEDEMDTPPALFTGIKSENFPGDYDMDGDICFRQDQPLPSMIQAVLPQMVTQDR